MLIASQSLEQVLNKVIEGAMDGYFNAEAVHKMDKEIEKRMEEFDREKRKKAARSEEELSKLVITV